MQFVFGKVLSGAAIVICATQVVSAQEAASARPETPAIQSTRFDDWYHRCADVKAADGKTVAQCEVAQIAQVKQGDQDVNVLTLAIAKTAPEAGKKASGNDLLLTALVPLNVVLPIGLGLAVLQMVAYPLEVQALRQELLIQTMIRNLKGN